MAEHDPRKLAEAEAIVCKAHDEVARKMLAAPTTGLTIDEGWRKFTISLELTLISAIAEALTPAPGWRPIATAPKNEGEWIFTCRAGSKIPVVTGWDEAEQVWFSFNLHLSVERNGEPYKPTHWMPLIPPIATHERESEEPK